METHDDDLIRFEAEGAAPLPAAKDQGYVDNDGARIWYAAYGSGRPVIFGGFLTACIGALIRRSSLPPGSSPCKIVPA